MNQFTEIKPSFGRVALSCVTALILGLLQPFAVIFQIMFPMPGISIAAIAAAVSFGGAGLAPVIVLGAASALSLLFIFGIKLGLLAMLLWAVPAAVMVSGIRRRDPFFRQLTKAIIAAVAVTALAAAGVAMVFGADVVKQVIDQLRASFTSQQELFWEVLAPMIRVESFDEFVEYYYVMFNTLELYYNYYLLSNLFNGAILSAAVGVLWGNWRVARRGGAMADSYRGLSQWYLPANTTWGLLMMLAAAFILAKIKLPAAQSAWVLVSSLCQTVFLIQCMAAFDRRMKTNGSGHGMRVMMILLMTGMSYLGGMITMVAILGAASALFGSKGAATPLIAKYNDKSDGKGR